MRFRVEVAIISIDSSRSRVYKDSLFLHQTMTSLDKKGIAFQLAVEPERTPEERLVMDETLDATVRRVHARVHCNMVIEMADQRSERIQRGMESIKR